MIGVTWKRGQVLPESRKVWMVTSHVINRWKQELVFDSGKTEICWTVWSRLLTSVLCCTLIFYYNYSLSDINGQLG